MNSLLHDNLAGIRQIKTYVREREEHARFNATSGALRDAVLKIMHVWAVYNPAMSFIGALGAVLVVGFGGRAVLHGDMSVGDLVAFLWLVGALYEPIGRLHSLNQILQAGRAAGERVFANRPRALEIAEHVAHRERDPEPAHGYFTAHGA